MSSWVSCFPWVARFPVSKSLTLLYLQSMPGSSSWFVVSLQGGIRFLMAGLLMAPICWRELRSLRGSEVIQGFGLGFCGGAGMLFQMDGLAYTSASISAFLTQAYCILLPLYHLARTRMVPGMRDLLAIFMVVSGIVILANLDWRTFRIGRRRAHFTSQPSAANPQPPSNPSGSGGQNSCCGISKTKFLTVLARTNESTGCGLLLWPF